MTFSLLVKASTSHVGDRGFESRSERGEVLPVTHKHILCKQKLLFWMRLNAINRLTALIYCIYIYIYNIYIYIYIYMYMYIHTQ